MEQVSRNGDLKTARGLSNRKKKRERALKSGKLKNPGLVETLKMKRLGAKDGKEGIPRKDESGVWTSPLIRREVAAYEEFGDRIWGKLQIETHDIYVRLDTLVEEILDDEERLEDLTRELGDIQAKSNSLLNTRKKGEEMLAEHQVRARRQRENQKAAAPIKSKITSLREKLADEYQEFWELKSYVVEVSNTTLLICERVMYHAVQRITLYWNAAMKRHPAGAEMPVVPEISFVSQAENTYMERHQRVLSDAAILIEETNPNECEKEAI